MICEELKIVHISICRNASTSISKAFRRKFPEYKFINKHHSVSNVGEVVPEEILNTYRSFCVVRNPFDRMVSMWLWVYLRWNNISFKKFLRNIQRGFKHKHKNERSELTGLTNTWIEVPQIKWITDKTSKIRVDKILRFENLDSDLDKLCKEWSLPLLTLPITNTSKGRSGIEKGSWKKYYEDEEDLDIVRELFKEDFETFNYQTQMNKHHLQPRSKKTKRKEVSKDVTKTKETPLCKLAYKYGTDKCPKIKHNFTPIYYSLFKGKRKSVKLVFEMGIGFYKNMQVEDKIYDPGLKRWYYKGASLKMWRDFFPNAQIIGADIRPITQFKDERIRTYICDESDSVGVKKLLKKYAKKIDIFIDDASHNKNLQVLLAKTALPFLKKDSVYIVEDVSHPEHIIKQLAKPACAGKYNSYAIKCSKRLKDDNLIVIKKT